MGVPLARAKQVATEQKVNSLNLFNISLVSCCEIETHYSQTFNR